MEHSKQTSQTKPVKPLTTAQGLLSVSPLLVFLLIYLGTSIILNDFYKMPITVAFLVSSIYAIAISRGHQLEERIKVFSSGAADPNILLMIWIFIMAGAFAGSAKAIGAVDATVNLTLSVLPDKLLLAGVFLASCFISLCIGTSVGTIVALTPVAVGISSHLGIDVAFMVGVVVGGSFFGDNLSFISDTTIAATKTQGCMMRDKFRANVMIVTPAAFIIFLIYIMKGMAIETSAEVGAIDWIKVVPYLLVLITAIAGLDVLLVLTIGLCATGIVGLLGGQPFFEWLSSMSEGILSMSELIIVTLLAGGLLSVIRFNGGIDWLISVLTRRVHSARGAECCIAGLVSMANLCTANNTIAIITTGHIARDISSRFGVDPRKAASILDTFSCFVQGLIPYGAQMLMAAGLASISPASILPHLYYPFCMGICAILSIIFRYPRRISQKKDV